MWPQRAGRAFSNSHGGFFSLSTRSRSESRLHPALFNNSSKVSPGRNGVRCKTPPRQSSSLLDLSLAGGGNNHEKRGGGNTPCRGGGDRFIPNRSTTDWEFAQHSLSRSRDDLSSSSAATSGDVAALAEQLRRQKLSQVLLEGTANGNADGTGTGRILSFRSKAPAADEAHANNLKVLYSTGKPKASQAAKTRQVPQKPEKILDAPDFVDDFYLHLLDWSSTNHLAVALATSLFVWNASDGSIDELFSREDDSDMICSVRWVTHGSVLAASGASGCIELWDASEGKTLRSMSGHTARVACLDWSEHVLASGCKDGSVHLHDVRVAEHQVATFNGHSQVRMCSVKRATM